MIGCKKLKLCVALGLVLLFQAACATTASTKESIGSPRNWVMQFDDHQRSCNGITDRFANTGERYAGESEATQGALLAAAVFSLVLPGGAVIESVALDTEKSLGNLAVALAGESERREDLPVSCEQGWWVTKQSRRGQYLGEGVIEKQFDQTSYFRQGSTGELIVRVVVDAEFNSMFLFDSNVDAEAWYRFQPMR